MSDTEEKDEMIEDEKEEKGKGKAGRAAKGGAAGGKKFEVKKWNAVALWAWGKLIQKKKPSLVPSWLTLTN